MKQYLAALALVFAVPAYADTGEYLARAADCVACHTTDGGAPYAGGRAFKLPMGTIYSPNITPDKATGIGNYTDDEFVDALQKGIGRGGKRLYPAMPYNSYTRMSRADALAIKSYLFTLKPVHAAAPADDLRFPYNQRWTLWFWNKLNNPDRRFEPDAGKSPEWNRGAYLVQALGHCEQCHTPRNWMYGLKSGATFAGATQAGWRAYNISSDAAHGIGGWSDADLVSYLSTGYAKMHGPASGPMAEAVGNSLRFLTPQDIHAMVVYLRDVPAQQDGLPAPKPGEVATNPDQLGAHVFAVACAGCHLPTGQGRQSPWAALAGDHSTADPAAINLLQVLTHGTVLQTGQGQVFMHSFTGAYSDQELAAVAKYVGQQFGGISPGVTPDDVAKAK
jgi:mono/diheme cytochrome c family protein